MPGFRKPGPLGLDPFEFDDDCFYNLRDNPGFGGFGPAFPVGTGPLPASPFYERVKQELRSQYVSFLHWGTTFVDDYEGARCVVQAAEIAVDYVPAAIVEQTGYQLASLLQGLIPGLVQMVAVVGASAFLGSVMGGIVGSLAGGVGAAPGAVVGGELGFDVGMAVLSWLGLSFLAVSIGKGLRELMDVLHTGMLAAWMVQHQRGEEEEREVQEAARHLARAAGIVVRLILEGIVAYLLKKAAVGSTGAAIGTVKGVQAGGVSAVSEATVAELVGRLRASGRLGKTGFADWVEKNWRDLVKNPKLGGEATKASAAVAGGRGQSAGAGTAQGASRPAPATSRVSPAREAPATEPTQSTPSSTSAGATTTKASKNALPVSIPKDVSTQPDEAFFWSGRSQGIGGQAKAQEIAQGYKGTTLEKLVEARGITMSQWDPASIEAWDDLSRQYAQGASGTVRAVIGDSLRPGNTWERIELPTLVDNPMWIIRMSLGLSQ